MHRTIRPAPLHEQYRTVVVGAGPAGMMAAARAASAGPVLLVDASALPRHKTCGGMIHELSARALARCGARIDAAIREPRLVRFRFHDWDADVRKPCSLTFFNVDRDVFDMLLLDALPSLVEVAAPCTVQRIEQDRDGCTVTVTTEDGAMRIACSLVIGADGARSRVRRCVAPQARPYVTLQDALKLDAPLEPFFDCIYTGRVGEGHTYSYVVPKNGHAIVGSIFYPGTRRPHEKHEIVLQEMRARLPGLGDRVMREAAAAAHVRTLDDVVAGRGRVLLAGEAGGFISPTSGEGISYALRTGEAAGRAAASDAETALAAYSHAVQPLMRQIRLKLALLPLMESRGGRMLARALPAPFVSAITRHL